jgi:hypothetical protein
VSLRFDLRGDRRLRLKKPAPGMLLGGRVEIVDLSVAGMGIQHDFPLRSGSEATVEFSWSGTVIRLQCTVARTQSEKSVPGRYRSGLQINKKKSEGFVVYRKRVLAALEKLREAEGRLPPVL